MMDQLALQAEGVDVRLGAAQILHGVDMHVRRGEVLALLGANGSGKSTFLRAALGLVPLSAGNLQILDCSVRTPRLVPWHRVGYVPQRVTATHGIPATALEVVLTGTLSRRRFHAGRRARDAARAALDSVGMADRQHSPLQELSGGQQQRVSIARALVRRPDLFLLDEPMSGIDHPSQAIFADLLTQLKAQEVTVVVVLHELGLLRPLIDRAVVLRQGRVAHDGALPEPAPHHDHPEHHHLHFEHGQEPEPAIQRTLP